MTRVPNDEPSSNIYTSPQVEPMLGFTVEQWRDDPDLWIRRIHEDDRERVVREHRASLASGDPFRTEYRLLAADDREVWVRDEAILVRGEDGQARFWRGVMADVTETKRAEERLHRSLEALRRTMEDRRRLLLRLEDAQEEERRRIAADIHDDSIQVMGAAEIRAGALALQLDDATLKDEARELRTIVHDAIERLRHLVFALRPPALDREGLAPALRAYASGIEPPPEVHDDLRVEPPPESRAILFRIAQEALTNARKHAGAGRITVSLSNEDDGVRLVVADDGGGFDVVSIETPSPGHIGLPTMLERAELAGGRLSIESAPGRGTSVSAWVPLEAPLPSSA